MRLLAFATFLAFTSLAPAGAPIPRKAPEFTIVDVNGKQTLLSSLKGKVVVMEILDTTCPHCQHASLMLTALHQQLGPRGFQPIGIAAYNNARQQVLGFIQQFSPSYPIGVSTNETVINFLGFSLMDRVMVPQIAVIDRKGVIRAQSPVQSDKNLQDQSYLHDLIDSLLKEGEPASPAKKPAPAPKKTT
jgi:peroxiredoxin